MSGQCSRRKNRNDPTTASNSMDANNAIINLLKNRWMHGVVCGILWALAFPKFDIAGFAWIIPGYLFLITRNCERGEAFRIGYVAGLIAHLISLHWLLYIPVKIAPIAGWLALCAYLALYPAFWSFLIRFVHEKFFREQDNFRYAVFAPVIAAVFWTSLEMVRARFLTGFPWNLLGASQYKMVFIIQIADIFGVYGVSFLLVWFSCAVVIAFERLIKTEIKLSFLLRPPTKWLSPMFFPLLALSVAIYYGTQKVIYNAAGHTRSPYRTEIKIALVQPSIPQTMIWDKNENEERFKKLIELIKCALTNQPDVVILPEAAIPDLFRYHPPTYKAITEIARENKVWMIIGADDAEVIDNDTNKIAFYNSSFLISPDGFITAQYSKQHLVMFGEYVPLSRWLPFLKHLTPIGDSEFTPGKCPQKFKFHITKNGERYDIGTSVIICFEDVIPHLVRKHVTDEIDFLVNLTNDGWFGESAAQWQHLANAVFRAVENRRTLVRCTNNGISCCVDEAGWICNVTPEDPQKDYRACVKICDLLIPSRNLWDITFYTRYGDVFGWICVAVSLGIFLPLMPLKLRKQNGRD